jgi:hypothetical protein
MLIKRKYFFLLCLISTLFPLLSSCNSKPSAEIEQSWKDKYREAILDGYSNFEAQYIDGDTGVAIFSYQISTNSNAKEVFEKISNQLRNYEKISETDTELILREPFLYISPKGFNEYHFLINTENGTITVMFGNFDSESKQKLYSGFIEKLNAYHREYTLKKG